MSVTQRHRDCPLKHIGDGDKCPHCRRLYAKDSQAGDGPKVPKVAGKSGQLRVVDRNANDADAPRKANAGCPALTPAQKQRAWRERKKATDPDYLKREAERKRRERKNG